MVRFIGRNLAAVSTFVLATGCAAAAGSDAGSGALPAASSPATRTSATRTSATGTPATPGGSPTTAEAHGTPCADGQLVASIAPVGGQRAHDLRGVTVELTNTSHASCSLRGYGHYRLLDRSGHRIGVRVAHGSTVFGRDPGPAAVSLDPGMTAYADLMWTEDPAAAPARTTGVLVLTAPGTDRPQRIRFGGRHLGGTHLTVTAFAITPEVSK